jgi:predicted metalloprotease with PDZ domain
MSIVRSLVVLICFTSLAAAQRNISERLRVDATDAPRNILHSVVTIPVGPGPVTVVYPKWIPGNHRPTGPIQNLTGLHFRANGKELDWQRDLVDMWAFHLDVPSGVSELEVSLDTLTYNGKSSAASGKVLDLNWNQVVLYPKDTPTDAVQVQASIQLPDRWRLGTALRPTSQSANVTQFQPVSLTRLVDSPLIAGLWFRQVQLTGPGESPVLPST